MADVKTDRESVERLVASLLTVPLPAECGSKMRTGAAAALLALLAEKQAAENRAQLLGEDARSALVERDEARAAHHNAEAARQRAEADAARMREAAGEAIRCISDGCEDEAYRILRAALGGTGHV